MCQLNLSIPVWSMKNGLMNVFLTIATSAIILHLHSPAPVTCSSSAVASAANVSETICSVQKSTNEGQSPRVLHRQMNGELPPECRHTICFPKCCKMGEILRGGDCVPTDLIFDPFVTIEHEQGYNFTDLDTDSYYLILGNPCRTWFEMGNDEVDVWCTGILTAYENNWMNYTDYYTNEYCLEYTENYTLAILCEELKVRNISSSHWSSSLSMLVSVTALLTTIAALQFLDKILNLLDKALLAFVSTQLIAYSMLTVLRLTGRITFGYSSCKYIGIVIQFFTLKSFLWVHIMCIDTLWTILTIVKKCPFIYPGENNFWTDRNILDDEDPKNYRIRGKAVKQVIVLVGYFVYVLFISLLHLIFIITMGPSIPFTYIDDTMILHGCEINSFSAILLFIIPILITVLNIIIFTVIFLTRTSLSKIRVHIKVIIIYKFWMSFLLFLLMTSIWTLEFLSMVFGGPEIISVIRDIVYIIEGPLIFTIFRVVKSLQYVPRKSKGTTKQYSKKLETCGL